MASKKQKPQFSLVDGTDALDLKILANLYKKLTGRKPTEAELEKAKEILDSPD